MQSIRFLIFFFSCMIVLSLLLVLRPSNSLQAQDSKYSRSVGTYFNWRTPSSLFPPSAIISLTDDNSTFFLARPAAFGPDLPARSLSGQLWIGSGFGDDHIGRTSPGSGQEGELGCSDVPGWSETNSYRSASRVEKEHERTLAAAVDKGDDHDKDDSRNLGGEKNTDSKWSLKSSGEKSDGTDDHLKPASKRATRRLDGVSTGWRKSKTPAHADIQSLQESAEIAGKVALLSRGGCGFLDKVEWAQRRGAVAVIIGDDVRGGPLVTMYARGDTSNVTIPALFTSHTTAHLLSSLMPNGGRQRFMSPRAGARAKFVKALTGTMTAGQDALSRPDNRPDERPAASKDDLAVVHGSGWFWSLFGTDDLYGRPTTNRKPPSADDNDWVLQTDFDASGASRSDDVVNSRVYAQQDSKPTDGFVIGVHDWRDPDLVDKSKHTRAGRVAKVVSSPAEIGSNKKAQSGDLSPADAATTPGSGEYAKAVLKASKPAKEKVKSLNLGKPPSTQGERGWLSSLVRGRKPTAGHTRSDRKIIDLDQPVINPVHMHDIHLPGVDYDTLTEHEGLWVTLSATSVSSSPFFDTLLVLVVSPLITLTIVYALLLLRSRIRRRRWRAPKSVVERLPVRTYQTMPSTSVSSISSAVSTPASMHTPLLSSAARPIVHRPRSRTELDMPSSSSMSHSQSLEHVEEKREAGLAEWRRKYGGKQKECVVCLEEYVDGISRVMSLPCGHEFHEGCITPWLTTRRRTCPICKGDVVRSLARSAGSTSSPLASHGFGNEDGDDIQEQAVLLTNDDPSSLRPISQNGEEYEDLESGFTENPDRTR